MIGCYNPKVCSPQGGSRHRLWRGLAVATAIALGLGITAYAVVHYSQVKSIENTMSTQDSAVLVQELFNPGDQWVVGETKDKVVSFANSGGTNQVIRFTYEEAWETAEGDLFTDEKDAAEINWTDELASEWTQIGEYYYYNTILPPDESTADVMTSVTIANTINNGSYAKEVVDYSDKIYTLTITMEALPVNSDVTAENWNVTFTETDPEIDWSTADSVVLMEQGSISNIM